MIPKIEFPRPDRERNNWLNLNGEWDFKLGDEADYSRKITVPFSWAAPLSGIHENVAGVGFYRREVEFEARERVFLCVGAADYICDIFVNGEKVTSHRGGYAQFDADVTDYWQAGKNEIIVRCEDFRRETQTYGKQGYGDIQGIWQTAWLEDRPAAHIESFRFVTKIDGKVTLKARVTGGDTLIARFDGREFIGKVSGGAAVIDMKFDSPKLWSPDSPYLYEGELMLGGDIVKTYFGIREIAAENGRILLNGKPIYINGTLDQAFNPRGHFTYPSDNDMRAEAYRLKRLGLNMARIHIKCEEPRKLYWMDKLGVMIMQDIPCFWGEPCAEAREAYEAEWRAEFERDYNHPCIIAWVMFNETWGLLSGSGDEREYLPETQEWVRNVYRAAKIEDPTRIIEDNSACRYDHVDTDINTWHFYINGYDAVKNHIKDFCDKAFPGSEYNFIGGNVQTDAPVMNSECGMVWGVEGSAGDSDIAWQYRYMLNEFRLHDKINGFVFTEFHDVVNEFNGYYRIDDRDKDFGYSYFARGMRVADLHSQDFLALDCPPCRTVAPGEYIEIPCVLSLFSGDGTGLSVEWELWHDGIDGKTIDMKGGFTIKDNAVIGVKMPDCDALCVLSTYLISGDKVISRNFTTFDVDAKANYIPVADGVSEGFERRWTALNAEKLCLGGAGAVSWRIPVVGEPSAIRVAFEASSKRVLTKDSGATHDDKEGNFMRGYLVDRGAFPNSYFMTDEDAHSSNLEIFVNDSLVKKALLENDYADARGALSWHYQPDDKKLDEAGSYGQLISFEIPSRLIPEIATTGAFTLTLKADNGVAIYGRKSGKYAQGITIETF